MFCYDRWYKCTHCMASMVLALYMGLWFRVTLIGMIRWCHISPIHINFDGHGMNDRRTWRDSMIGKCCKRGRNSIDTTIVALPRMLTLFVRDIIYIISLFDTEMAQVVEILRNKKNSKIQFIAITVDHQGPLWLILINFITAWINNHVPSKV